MTTQNLGSTIARKSSEVAGHGDESRPMSRSPLPRRALAWGVGCGWLALVAMTMLVPRSRLVFCDEVAFLDNTRLLRQCGMGTAFLRGMQGQAPGPLLNALHVVAAPLTDLEVPAVRLVHVLLMPLLLALLGSLIRPSRPGDASSLALAFASIPMLWHVSGYMCSDLPTLVAGVAGVLLLLGGLGRLGPTPQFSPPAEAVGAVLAGGLCYGVAILGRATFLGPLACLPLLLRGSPAWRRDAALLTGFAAAALVMSVPVFLVWGGLMPPQQAFVGRGVAPWHLVLSLAYGFFIAWLVSPRWLGLDRPTLAAMLATVAVALVANLCWLHVTFRPLGSLVPRLLSPAALRLYDHGMPALLAGLATGMVIAGVRHARRHAHDGRMLFLLAAGFAMLASAMKITHQYASPYSLQCLPFLALPFSVGNAMGRWDVVRIVTGMTLGLAAHAAWIAALRG